MSVAEAMRRWDRAARVYGPSMWPLEVLLLRRWRRRATAELAREGRILEIGAGPGMNTPFYPAGARVIATDLSPAMVARAARHGRSGVSHVVADAQQLPFREGVFDAGLATLVFCGVPHDDDAFLEIRRTVRPGGRLVLLEHVRPQGRVTGWLADRLESLTAPLFGEHVNRRTVENAAGAGFTIQRVENALGTLVRLVVART